MGANTIIMINQASKERKTIAAKDYPPRLIWKKGIVRSVIDQLLWLITLVLLADMAIKNRRQRLFSWWTDK